MNRDDSDTTSLPGYTFLFSLGIFAVLFREFSPVANFSAMGAFAFFAGMLPGLFAFSFAKSIAFFFVALWVSDYFIDLYSFSLMLLVYVCYITHIGCGIVAASVIKKKRFFWSYSPNFPLDLLKSKSKEARSKHEPLQIVLKCTALQMIASTGFYFTTSICHYWYFGSSEDLYEILTSGRSFFHASLLSDLLFCGLFILLLQILLLKTSINKKSIRT